MANESLNACPDCKGEVMHLTKYYEGSVFECQGCKRVWDAEELWNLVTRTPGSAPPVKGTAQQPQLSSVKGEQVTKQPGNVTSSSFLGVSSTAPVTEGVECAGDGFGRWATGNDVGGDMARAGQPGGGDRP